MAKSIFNSIAKREKNLLSQANSISSLNVKNYRNFSSVSVTTNNYLFQNE